MHDESPIYATIADARRAGLSDAQLTARVWERHGTTCAMLALDSSGMTRISHTQGIVHFLSRYMDMRDLVEPLFNRPACLGWRSFADNLFAEFRDADAALEVARAVHRVIRDQRLMLTEVEPFKVCIAVGQNRVLANGRYGVMGDEMNLVAKLAEDVAQGGDILLTESGYRSLAHPDAIAVEPVQLMIGNFAVVFYRLRNE